MMRLISSKDGEVMPEVNATIEIKLKIPIYVDDIEDVKDIMYLHMEDYFGDNLIDYNLLDVEEV